MKYLTMCGVSCYDMVKMIGVNDDIRRAIRVELAKRDMNQSDLAKQIGRTRQHVSAAIRGDIGKLPKIWQDILDGLDLELVVRERQS